MKRDLELLLGAAVFATMMFTKEIREHRKEIRSWLVNAGRKVVRYNWRALVCMFRGHVVSWSQENKRTHCVRCYKPNIITSPEEPTRIMTIKMGQKK